MNVPNNQFKVFHFQFQFEENLIKSELKNYRYIHIKQKCIETVNFHKNQGKFLDFLS